MELSVTKHAKSMYHVVMVTPSHHQLQMAWTLLHDLWFFPEYEDLKDVLNMVIPPRRSLDNYVSFEFKASREYFELVVDILSDHKYNDVTYLSDAIKLME